MGSFTDIFIIYNPKSTGNSQECAKELEQQLTEVLPGAAIRSIPTQYAGHAEELASELSFSHKMPLIVSSSGDGGYHEVINGVMRAKEKDGSAVCAVLPAENRPARAALCV